MPRSRQAPPGASRAFTGARTRVVWLHAVRGDQKNWDGLAADYELKGLDTAEGNAKVILPGPGLYGNPCISRDGKWIVYCTSTKGMLGKIYRVDWDGKKKLELAPGYVLDTWVHPEDGSQWAYYIPGGYQKGDLMRVRLDQPNVKELVFPRKAGQVAHTLSVSADGKRIGTEFPWPHAGIGITGKKPMWFRYGRGCNAIIAPDNSYRIMHMGGSVNHVGVMMYDAGRANARAVWFKQFPGLKAGSHSWVPRWSNHVRFVTVCAPLVYGRGLNDMDIYLGKFNEAFTEAKEWIKITDAPGQDVKAYAWIDPQLGYHQDEAPFRLEIPETLTPGAWRFDYGDGSKGSSRVHSYAKAGRYTIVARNGKEILKGTVILSAPTKPQIKKAVQVGERHVALTFSERVQVREPQAKLTKSGTRSVSFVLDPQETTALVKFAQPVAAGDRILLRGVRDQAQAANPIAVRAANVVRASPWPSKRNGLIFLWENGDADNSFVFPYDDLVANVRIGSPDQYDRFGALRLRRALVGADLGVLRQGTGGYFIRPAVRSKELSFEMTIHPASLVLKEQHGQKPAIMATAHHPAFFTITQVNNKLHFRCFRRWGDFKQGFRKEIATLPDAGPHHLLLTVDRRKRTLVTYLDGREVSRAEKTPDLAGVFGMWPPMFGAIQTHDKKRHRSYWSGKVEGVAMYSRVLLPEEVMANAKLMLGRIRKRPKIKLLKVEAELVGKTKTPKPEDIAPYTRALVAYKYRIVRVLDGKLGTKTIHVAHWGLRNDKPTAFTETPVGAKLLLVLEKYDENPRFETEVFRNDFDDDLEAERYFAVGVENHKDGKL